MNYAIRKPRDDLRHHTCGVTLPDGHVVVLEYNRSNHARIEMLDKHGYIVRESDVEQGLYKEEEYDRMYEGDSADQDEDARFAGYVPRDVPPAAPRRPGKKPGKKRAAKKKAARKA